MDRKKTKAGAILLLLGIAMTGNAQSYVTYNHDSSKKTAIVNLNRIYAIRRNLAASSEISFQGTHKQIYVSRAYIKVLKERLEEKRLER